MDLQQHETTLRLKKLDRAPARSSAHMQPLRPLGKPETRRLDIALAKALLAINTYGGQRRFKPERAAFLVEKLTAGLFTKANVAIAVMPDGTELLMNGQHCCHMVIETGQAVECSVERFFCQTDGDLSTLYSQFDTGVAVRTIGDQLHAWVQGTELAQFPLRCVRAVTEALAMLEHEDSARVSWNQEERWEALYANADLVPIIYQLVFRGASAMSRSEGFILRSPVLAAMILTLRKNQPVALEFWAQVRDGEMLSRTSPAYRLREWLKSHSLNTMGRGGQARASRREMLVRCLQAWNAHRSGKSTTLRYASAAPLPHVRS